MLEDPAVEKVVHGGRAALLTLNAAGIGLQGLHLDTHIGSYLLDPGAPGYALEEMARKYSGRELKAVEGVERDEDAAQGALALEGDPIEVEAEDASSARARGRQRSPAAVEPELDRLGMLELYRTIEHPLIPVLARMEEIGVRIDLDYLAEMAAISRSASPSSRPSATSSPGSGSTSARRRSCGCSSTTSSG